MSERTNWISVLALIGAGLALFLTVILNLCPVCAEKRAGGIDGNEAAKLSEDLSKHSLRLAQVEQRVSRLEGQATGAAAPVGTAPAFEPYVWTQLYPDSMLHTGEKNGEPVLEWKTMGSGDMIARAIVAAGQACPTITIGDQAVALVPREVIYPVSFPVTLCETPEVFPGSLAVKLGIGNSLSRSQDPKNILIIGDTGCRITFYTFQNCLYDAFGEGRWPFPRVVDSVLGKDRKIDLIIHVGDYHYRERPCPADQQALCGTANWGYNWTSWQADFFEPARKILAAAPWVFVRGNHENCDRAGTGWTNFMWPTLRDNGPKSCQDYHEPYVLKLADGLSLAVLDIANAESVNYYVGRDKNNRADLYKSWMKALPTADLEESVWFAMQQPPWQWPTKDGEKPNATEKQEQETAEKKACKETVIKHEKRAGIRDDTVKQIQKYLRAPGADMKAKIELVLAGDTHIFQALQPNDGPEFPWVVISGMGGTKLDDRCNFKVDSRDIFSEQGASIQLDEGIVKGLENPPAGQSVRVFGWRGFGYTILHRVGEKEWEANVYDENCNKAFNCKLSCNAGCFVPSK